MLHKPQVLMVNNDTGLEHRHISDAEWNFIEPFVIETPRRPGTAAAQPPAGGRRHLLDRLHRVALAQPAARVRQLGLGLPAVSLRWTKGGLWEGLLEALEHNAKLDHPDVIDVHAGVDRETMASYFKTGTAGGAQATLDAGASTDIHILIIGDCVFADE